MAIADNLSGGQVTKFDKAAYTKLTSFVNDVNTDMHGKFLKPSSGVTLDSSLSDVIKPGSHSWGPAAKVIDGAGAFGGSVHTELAKLSTEWTRYAAALQKASGVFEHTSDLAEMSASDFTGKYPGLGTAP